MAHATNELLTDLLQEVSRSFYLTLRVLPKSVRSQIGLAYLLARTTDTIADTEIVPLDQRLQMLEQLRDRILGKLSTPLEFGELARQQGAPAERVLLEKIEASLALLQTCSAADQKLIRQVLDTITSGQVLDLHRFAGASADHVLALGTDAELEDYTYRVAGCVGGFWTKICIQNQFRGTGFLAAAGVSELDFEILGIRFGKGLQLVNILRDLPKDLRSGRCYLAAERLAQIGLKPADLLDPAQEPKLRPLYNELLDRAEGHLRAGWTYTNLIPRRQARIRLACAWPILIGMKTIGLLRANAVLDPAHRIKVSRAEVRQILMRSLATYPLPGWKHLPDRL